jgi:predicted metalloprotease with PDZ domain
VPDAVRIRYRVDATEPTGHRARVSLLLEGIPGPKVDLVLPAWAPGSYHLMNYVRGFRDVSARAGPGSPPLPVARSGAYRWTVEVGTASHVEVDYTVYGHGLVTEGLDLTPDHLLLNAVMSLPFVDGHLDSPYEVELHLPPEWKVITELEQVGARPPVYRAANYDELVDSPIDAGHPLVLTIRPHGIPHRIALCGDGGNYEAHRLEEDLTKMVDATIRLMGDSPLTSYTFFVHLSDIPDGGLEHASSNSAVVSRTIFQPLKRYQRFLSLESHEYFHLYNVKRVRPKALGPFDYTREVYTGQLWWMEGTTDYFSDLVLRRAGLYTTAKFLEEQAELAKEMLDRPGRHSLSLEDLSRITWVDFYQQFEESPNQMISYYTKGHLVSLALDLEIRSRTGTKASLETVMRYLWTEYGKHGRGLEEDELSRVAERATGLDLTEFFQRYVRGTAELDLDPFARLAGLTFGPKEKPPDDDSPEPGYLGIRWEDRHRLVRVTHVLIDTPAHRAGISPGDELVALNGEKVMHEGFPKALEGFPAGSPVDVALFRRGRLTHAMLTTGTPPPEKYRFAPVASASEAEKGVYADWLGEPWAPPSPAPAPPAPPPAPPAGGGRGTAFRA